jgi:biotin carboxyl carrier protein
MDRDRILRLLAQLRQSRATELEVREGDFRVRLVRAAAGERHSPAEGAGVTEAGAPQEAVPAGAHHGVLVVSHVVGFFRRAREPGGQPLAEVGQQVTKGQPIAVVEALRQAVAIEAPVDGTVLEFLADDGMRVEYATPLARLLPADAE